LIGKLSDDGITNKFLKSLEKELQPNTSVLVVYARSDAERRGAVMKRLAVFGPKLLESDLPPELEKTIQQEMQAVVQGRAAAGATADSSK